MHMRFLLLVAGITMTGACAVVPEIITDSVVTAQPFVGLQERQDRKTIKQLVGVDPVRTEWCAAFVNAVLEIDGIPGSDSVSDTPLMARSFLSWGEPVERDQIRRGDVVVFPRGTQGWQGHVGFYVETYIQDGVEYWVILGGNQSNEVRYDLYEASTSLGIRRWIDPTDVASIQRTSIFERLRNLYNQNYSDDV